MFVPEMPDHATGWKTDYQNLTSEINNIQTIDEVKQVLTSNSFSFSDIFLGHNKSDTNYSTIFSGSMGRIFFIKPLHGSVTLDPKNTLNIQLNAKMNYYMVIKTVLEHIFYIALIRDSLMNNSS